MRQSPPLSADRPPRGWWTRHWRWAVPLVVVLALMIVVGCSMGWLLRWSALAHASPPMREAMRRAACSPEVVSLLGEPLQADRLPHGDLRVGPDGRQDVGLMVGVEGPLAAGWLIVRGTRMDDSWDYPVMYVLDEHEQTIDLSALDDEAAALECALEICRAEGRCPITSLES